AGQGYPLQALVVVGDRDAVQPVLLVPVDVDANPVVAERVAAYEYLRTQPYFTLPAVPKDVVVVHTLFLKPGLDLAPRRPAGKGGLDLRLQPRRSRLPAQHARGERRRERDAQHHDEQRKPPLPRHYGHLLRERGRPSPAPSLEPELEPLVK